MSAPPAPVELLAGPSAANVPIQRLDATAGLIIHQNGEPGPGVRIDINHGLAVALVDPAQAVNVGLSLIGAAESAILLQGLRHVLPDVLPDTMDPGVVADQIMAAVRDWKATPPAPTGADVMSAAEARERLDLLPEES